MENIIWDNSEHTWFRCEKIVETEDHIYECELEGQDTEGKEWTEEWGLFTDFHFRDAKIRMSREDNGFKVSFIDGTRCGVSEHESHRLLMCHNIFGEYGLEVDLRSFSYRGFNPHL